MITNKAKILKKIKRNIEGSIDYNINCHMTNWRTIEWRYIRHLEKYENLYVI